jgi:hypothetical protein
MSKEDFNQGTGRPEEKGPETVENKDSAQKAREKIMDIFAEKGIYLHGIGASLREGKQDTVFTEGLLSAKMYRKIHGEELPEQGYWSRGKGDVTDKVICVGDISGEGSFLAQIKSLEILKDNLDVYFLPENEQNKGISFQAMEHFMQVIWPHLKYGDILRGIEETYKSDDFAKLENVYKNFLNTKKDKPDFLASMSPEEFKILMDIYDIKIPEPETGYSAKEETIKITSQLIDSCLEVLKENYQNRLRYNQEHKKLEPPHVLDPTLIIKTNRTPLYYTASGDVGDLQFADRIRPDQIKGLLLREGWKEEETFQLAEKFSLPVYDMKGDVLWPK